MRLPGGIKPGTIHGATDNFGPNIVQNPVHIYGIKAILASGG